MANVGSAAPPFDCTAVVAGRLVRLGWRQVHDNTPLVLLFDSIGGPARSPDHVVAVFGAVAGSARVAAVCRDDPDELLARSGGVPAAVPLIVDPDGRIAALYGLRPAGTGPLRGHVLIDAAGTVRQAAASDFPAAPDIGELLRAIAACTAPADAGRGS